MIKDQFRLLISQPRWSLAVALSFIIGLAVDFNQRVKVSVSNSFVPASFDISSMRLKSFAEPIWTEPMQNWLATYEQPAKNLAGESTQTLEPEPPSMPGASALGDLQVRVRGIFKFQSQAKTDFALIESYNQQENLHQILRYKTGAVLGNYKISALEHNVVRFQVLQQNAENNLPEITIQVFGKSTTE